MWRNSLAVQWSRLCIFTAEGPGSIPGQGTKIPQATWRSQKNKITQNKTKPCFTTKQNNNNKNLMWNPKSKKLTHQKCPRLVIPLDHLKKLNIKLF